MSEEELGELLLKYLSVKVEKEYICFESNKKYTKVTLLWNGKIISEDYA